MSDEELIARMHDIAHEYPAIVNHLIARHTGLVNYIVSTLTIISSDRDDLVQEGMIGLFDAIGKYDPSRGASFRTYASIEIRGNVFNAIRSRNNQKNLPLSNYLTVDITGGISSPELGSYFIIPSTDMTPEETAIFDEIPEQLSKHEKKFVLSALGKGSKYRDYESSFLWLEDSMICNVCYNSTEPSVGIKLNRDRTTMKIYMGDTGLLISHAFDENGLVSDEVYKKLLLGKLEMNEGMIFENVVAQMLSASGHKLYFYSNSSRNDKASRMEIDYLLTKRKVTSRHNVSPIEVKSGKRYTYSSLNKFSAKYHEQLNTPYILHTADYAEKNGIVYLPVYMAWLL